jgi:putative restriction enzyme bgcI subunit beta
MAKIDTSGWKEFEIGKLFPKIKKPPVLHNRQVIEDENGIPYVVRTKFDNGIKCRVQRNDEMKPSPAGVISFGAENATFFYQREEFVSGRDIYYIDTQDLSDGACMFLTACLQPIARKYSYNYGLFPDLLKSEQIKLPVDSQGCPDWAYMDSFMEKVMKESEAYLENLRLADEKKTAVDISQWKEFEIGKLFDVVKGTRLTKANMRKGSNRFIGSSAMCNGLTTQIANYEKLHPANTITICYNGSVGETFYQDEPFWASDDVNVLYPKFEMSKDIGLFIIPLIRSIGQRYAFVDKWRLEAMKKDCIKLPIDCQGNPDWAYIDSYMQAVMQDAESNIETLSKSLA